MDWNEYHAETEDTPEEYARGEARRKGEDTHPYVPYSQVPSIKCEGMREIHGKDMDNLHKRISKGISERNRAFGVNFYRGEAQSSREE